VELRRGIARVLLTTLLLAIVAAGTLAHSPSRVAAAPRSAASDDAKQTAYLLSVLESDGSFNALYDLIHPDARSVIPRDAAVGWYLEQFAPRGASPAVVTGVRFVSWRWAVTGKVYPDTAEVSYVQEFWDDGAETIEEDVVRLVQDDQGMWRWFFGRNRAFVEEMIDAYVEPLPAGTLLATAVEDVGGFWRNVFGQSGLAYQAPDVVVFRTAIDSICEGIGGGPAFYCGFNDTIYVDEDWYVATADEIGDFAWVTILAHEWGHHAQDQLADNDMEGSSVFRGVAAVELEADCLAGVYAQDAEVRGLLATGDLDEAVTISNLAGGGTHGTGDERLSAFMAGYLDGLYGCGLTL